MTNDGFYRFCRVVALEMRKVFNPCSTAQKGMSPPEKNVLTRWFIVVGLFCLISVGACHPDYTGKPTPRAKNGVLDLRSWDFVNDGPVTLNGEWNLFWEKLPEDPRLPDTAASFLSSFSPDGLYDLPKEKGWRNHPLADGTLLPHIGYGTFHLTLLLPDQNDSTHINPHLAIGLARSFTSHTLQVHNLTTGPLGAPVQRGTVGSNRQESVPQNRNGFTTFTPAEEIQLLWQISNFHYYIGGPTTAPTIGTYDQLQGALLGKFFKDAFILGLLAIMGLYHVVLFLLHRRDKAPLWFGIFCLQIAGYSLVVDGYLNSQVNGAFAWALILKLYYGLFLYPSICTFFLFIKGMFPRQVNNKIAGVFITASLICSVVSVALPLDWIIQRYIHYAFLISILPGIAYILSVMVKSLGGAQRTQVLILLTGIGLFSLALVHDVLGNFELIPFYFNWTSTGLSLFILFQSVVIALNNRKAHRDKYLAQKKGADSLQQADKLKDEFLANTSHELRTPLHGIVGLAESLVDGARGELTSDQKHDLAMIINSGKRLTGLVDDILDHSKIKFRELKLHRRPTDIYALVNVTVDLSAALLGSREIELKNQVPPSLPLADADENRIQQVLFNLIGNALKFTHQGEVVISAITDNNRITITVSDTGVGIPAEKLEEIFASFGQIDSSIVRQYGGTGLGLTISRQLIELHGGTIDVVSEVGKGSSFSFSLPVSTDQTKQDSRPEQLLLNRVAAYQPAVPITADESRSPGPGKEQKTILVVDDETINQQVLLNYLPVNQYNVVTVDNGFEALESIAQGRPDLVLLDLMMPKMSGFEVCRRIRESYPPSVLPVIMLTAKNQIADLVQGFHCGANDYLAKPFSREELLSRIHTHLKLIEFAEALQSANTKLEDLIRSLEKTVTERTSELVTKNNQQKELLHILCHDLSNPLINIKGALQYIIQEPTFFDQMKNVLLTSAENGLNLIDIIREISALEEGLIDVKPDRFRLRNLIEESISILNQRLQQKNIAIDLAVDDDMFVWVEKTTFVNSVINNLLSNAIKFSYPGSRISVTARSADNHAFIEIADNGIGIPEQLQPRLFDMTKKTNRMGTNGESGTGFGMPLVKKFLEAYEGAIKVDSKDEATHPENHGTWITLTLKTHPPKKVVESPSVPSQS